MNSLSRRAFVRAGLAAMGGAWAGVGCSQSERQTPLSYALGELGKGSPTSLAPTPTCESGAAVATTAEIEGPYYTPTTPRRASLIDANTGGRRLHLRGRVVDTRCRPIPGALLDFWQADAGGGYDNDGFRLRGHQFAGRDGTYALDAVVPGAYSDGWTPRTPHLHVKVQGPVTPLLTTQLYLPEHADQNQRDRFYHSELLMAQTAANPNAVSLRFDFVLALA